MAFVLPNLYNYYVPHPCIFLSSCFLNNRHKKDSYV